jgi:hypothetical protein
LFKKNQFCVSGNPHEKSSKNWDTGGGTAGEAPLVFEFYNYFSVIPSVSTALHVAVIRPQRSLRDPFSTAYRYGNLQLTVACFPQPDFFCI